MNRSGLLTAVVLTKNEAANLAKCLAAIPQHMARVVVDSGSTDDTIEIAREHGARVCERPWSGFADQRNFAIFDCGIETKWILFVDADEFYPASFYEWAETVMQNDAPVDVYNVPSTLFLDGWPLRYAPGYPIYHPRLVRRSSVRFERNYAGHGEKAVAEREAEAPVGYDHYFQSGDLTPWLSKHIGLAQLTAEGGNQPASTKRGRLAAMAPRGPLRAVMRFLYHYVFKMGLRDGAPGLRYSVMYAWYELTIWLIAESKT